jgi:hypothetical protein
MPPSLQRSQVDAVEWQIVVEKLTYGRNNLQPFRVWTLAVGWWGTHLARVNI